METEAHRHHPDPCPPSFPRTGPQPAAPAGRRAAGVEHGQLRQQALAHVAARSTGPPIDRTLRVTLNFHPDRTTRAGGGPARLVLQALAEDGVYRSQFVTGTSNGGLTAYRGGDRWRWESRMFGGAYDEAPGAARPVYGALNHRGAPFGGAPRYGSAHLRLRPCVLDRTTFCYPDSVTEPVHFGVASRMALVGLALADGRDPLDDYVEAQVHAPVSLSRDVEALVLDPSHRGTEVEAAARQLPCPVEWHAGFRTTVEELARHPDFRGPEYVELAAALAVGGRLDPRILGAAFRAGEHDPQSLKRVWHCLARFGAPPHPGRSGTRG